MRMKKEQVDVEYVWKKSVGLSTNKRMGLTVTI